MSTEPSTFSRESVYAIFLLSGIAIGYYMAPRTPPAAPDPIQLPEPARYTFVAGVGNAGASALYRANNYNGEVEVLSAGADHKWSVVIVAPAARPNADLLDLIDHPGK